MSKAQFPTDMTILTTADSGWRDPHKCHGGMFHTTENGDGALPENIARWQLDRKNQSSYNVLFGADPSGAKTVRSNDDDYSPWSAGMPGNRRFIHASAVGRAARTRQQWFDNPKQLEALARWAADLNRRYGIPLRWLTVEQVRGGKERGFTSHGVYWQAIAKAQGMDYRWDPGHGFPHDWVLKRAHEINNPPPKKVEVPKMSSDYAKDARAQLTGSTVMGQYPGWDMLGGRTVVEALGAIGEALKLDGFKDIKK